MSDGTLLSPPQSPYVIGVILTSNILMRELELVYAQEGLAYHQEALKSDGDSVSSLPDKWSVYTSSSYSTPEQYMQAMSDFFTRLDAAGWEVSTTYPIFIFEAETDWLTSLTKRRMHHKMLDAMRRYRASRSPKVDTAVGT